MTHAVAVFTNEPTEQILSQGGTGYWVTTAKRAADYPYVVCVRNRNHPSSPDDAEHGAAFLIGRISGAVEVNKTQHGQSRVLIRISEYAEVKKPERAWGETRNPVWYTTLEQLGIDLEKLTFKPLPEALIEPTIKVDVKPRSSGLSIAEAKEALAIFYDVPTTNVTITIQG